MQQHDTDNDQALWNGLIDDYVAGAGWSPDGRRAYVASVSGWLYGFSGTFGTEIFRVQAHPDGLNTLAVSPLDGQLLTAGKDGLAKLWQPDTGVLLAELPAGADWVEHAAFSPDGQHILTAAGKTLILWRNDGSELIRYTDFESTISAIHWRDADHFAVACYGAIRLFQVGSKRPFERFTWKTPMISLLWSPDGRYVLAGTQDARIQVWKTPFIPGNELEMSGYPNKVKELSWCVPKQWVATNSGKQIMIWDMAGKGPEGQRPMSLPGHIDKITRLAFQHTGEWLASGDTMGLVIVRHTREPSYLIEDAIGSPIAQLAWSADGQRLLIGTESGQVLVWQHE